MRTLIKIHIEDKTLERVLFFDEDCKQEYQARKAFLKKYFNKEFFSFTHRWRDTLQCCDLEELYDFEKEHYVFDEETFWEGNNNRDDLYLGDVEDFTEVVKRKAFDYTEPVSYLKEEEFKALNLPKEISQIIQESREEDFYFIFSGEYVTSLKNYCLNDFFKNQECTGRTILSIYSTRGIEGMFLCNQEGEIFSLKQNELDFISFVENVYKVISEECYQDSVRISEMLKEYEKKLLNLKTTLNGQKEAS